MASFLSRIWRRVKGVFRSEPAQVDPIEWRGITRAEVAALGLPKGTRQYVPRATRKIGTSTPRISVRSYQQAQVSQRLEERARLYKSGEKPRHTRQSRTIYPKRFRYENRPFKGGKEYRDIPWEDMPKYYKRMRKAGKVQIMALGETKQRYGGGGAQWRTVAVTRDGEAENIIERMNSERGFEGFSATNPPIAGAIIIWPKR